MEPSCPIYDAPCDSDMVRHRIILSCDQVEQLKKWVGIKCESIGLEALHLSTFVVTCSLIWVCKVKSKDPDTEVTDPKDDDSYCLTFLADCRNRSKLSVPSTYFGNCLTICHVELQKEKLVGENGILEAVSAIGGEVRGLRGDPLKGFEWIVSGRRRRELGRQSQHVMIIAGSPKLNAYETDFGWGRPNMSEILHADDAGAMWLSDSREQERGGIEVGLALSAFQMKKFNAILEEQLIDMDVVAPHELSILNDRNTRGRYIRLSSNVVQSQLDKPINLIDACHIGIGIIFFLTSSTTCWLTYHGSCLPSFFYQCAHHLFLYCFFVLLENSCVIVIYHCIDSLFLSYILMKNKSTNSISAIVELSSLHANNIIKLLSFEKCKI